MKNVKILLNKHNKFVDIFTSKQGWGNWCRCKITNKTLTYVKGHPLSKEESKFVKESLQCV